MHIIKVRRSRAFLNSLPVLSVLFLMGMFQPDALGRPEYFARYMANPFARPELKTCAVCHENPKGGGPRNEFGQAFSRASRQFTPELRAQFRTGSFRIARFSAKEWRSYSPGERKERF